MSEVTVPFDEVFHAGLTVGLGSGVALGAGVWAAFALLDFVSRALFLWLKRRSLAKWVSAGESPTDQGRVAM